MPPQNIVPAESYPLEEDDFALVPEKEDHELDDKNFDFNIKGIISDLRNLDYSKVRWRNVFLFAMLHLYSVYGIYLVFTNCMWLTLFFAYVLSVASIVGVTMGSHRLWAHRSFKAVLPLRAIVAVFQTIAFQNSIYDWARDHRGHHKFSETDGDPHNAKRGFFFCHMGWLMYRKHPDVIQKGKTLDMSDLINDPVVWYQHKYYLPLVLLACFVMPTLVPWYFWGENWITALVVCGFTRYCYVLHVTWMVNSLAHWVGSKPFDKTIYASENKVVASLSLGEGWHNYHHVFPFDYRAAELGGYFSTSFTTVVIDFFSRIGWVYDRKVASKEMCENRAKRTGDGSFGRTSTAQKHQAKCQ